MGFASGREGGLWIREGWWALPPGGRVGFESGWDGGLLLREVGTTKLGGRSHGGVYAIGGEEEGFG